MTSNVGTKNFSSYADKNSDGFNDLDQLAQDTNIVKVERDEVSSLEKVVLNSGPFAFDSTSYLMTRSRIVCLSIHTRSKIKIFQSIFPQVGILMSI